MTFVEPTLPGARKGPAAPALDTALVPVAHSILSAEGLQALVARAYAIDRPESCQLLASDINDTYLVATRDKRHVARVYGAGWRSPSEIAYELDLLTHLAARSVSVALPIAGKDGRWMRPLLTPEGSRTVVLFTYVEGTPLSWSDESHSYLAGQLAARVHAASDDFTSRHARVPLDLEHLIDAPLAELRPSFTHRPDDWLYVEALAAKLRAAVGTARFRLDWGVCHGDLHAGNIHISEDQALTIFDFDFCGPGWRAYDFAVIRSVARFHRGAGLFDAFLRGYTETRPLGAADLRAIPVFHAISELFYLGLNVCKTTHWGSLRLSDSYLDGKVAFFREWEAEHLVA